MDIPIGTYKMSMYVPYEPVVDDMVNKLLESPDHIYVYFSGLQVYDLSPAGRIRIFVAAQGMNFSKMTRVEIRDYIDGMLGNLEENDRE